VSNSVMPESGNLAWAPLTALEEVEIFDRYNGVPTLGVVRTTKGDAHLFWRVIGYTGDISLWLYVPLSPGDELALEGDEGPSLLDGIVFGSPLARFVTVGVSDLHRLVFEREWNIPPNSGREDIVGKLVDFVGESLQIALDEGLPPTRRERVAKAKEAVRHLVAC
jgi:hypothetical protein